MSLHYRETIQKGSAYQIAKLMRRKTFTVDHEDIVLILEAAMWMIDDMQEEIEKLKTEAKEKIDAIGKVKE